MMQLSIHLIVALTVCTTVCLMRTSALPQPSGNQELDVLQVPLINGKQINVLTLDAKDQEQLVVDRNKRTIGLLRELFPDISKEIDSIVNRIIAQVIRVAGPGLLNSILSVNRRGAGSGNTTRSSKFDADFDDDSFGDNEGNDVGADGSTVSNPVSDASDTSSQITIDLPTLAPEPEMSSGYKVSARKSETNVTASTSLSTTTISTSPSLSLTVTTERTKIRSDEASELLSIFMGIQPIITMTATATSATEETSITTNTEISQLEPTQYPNNKDRGNILDEPKLLTILDDINRLLNFTNYFITTRHNSTTSTATLLPPTPATMVTPTVNNITKFLRVHN